MKAIIIKEYGDLEVLKTEPIEIPTPNANELLVEVHACGLNPVDIKLRKGALKEMLPLIFPHILGGDISGVVRSTGKQVTDFKVGDEVYFSSRLNKGGGYAEFCVVEEELVAKKPQSLSHVEAASLPVVGLTSVQALRDFSGLKSGQKVLIHAGAGGVGSFAIQYAKMLDAEVFTTARKQNHKLIQTLGADHAIDYQNEDFTKVCQNVGGMDVVLETIGGLNYPRSIEASCDGGSVPCIVNPPDADTKTLVDKKKIKTDFFLLSGNRPDLQAIATWVDEGKIKPRVTRVLGLDEIRFAHEQFELGRIQGKWVVQIRL